MNKSAISSPAVRGFGAICLLVLAFPASVMAQTNPQAGPFAIPRITRTGDFAIASTGDFTYLALSVNRLHGLGKSHRFKIGYGLRFTSGFGGKTDYATAPARLTSGTQSIVALFTETIENNIDTLHLTKAQVNSLNLSINLEYAITKRLSVGANIDAIGFSFGSQQSGTFQANAPVRSALSNTVQTAKPTSFNLLLVSDSDLGSLNSEYYVRYRIRPELSLRAGLGFLFTEYTTSRKLTLENDRFRSKNYLPMVAVSYHF